MLGKSKILKIKIQRVTLCKVELIVLLVAAAVLLLVGPKEALACLPI